MKPLLHVSGLGMDYLAGSGAVVPALRDLHLEVSEGETVGVLGESGSGKSSLALALLQLLPANASPLSGEILYQGRNLLTLQNREWRKLRGAEISLVFQEPALENRSEEHTSELQSRQYLVCRLLLEKKKKNKKQHNNT